MPEKWKIVIIKPHQETHFLHLSYPLYEEQWEASVQSGTEISASLCWSVLGQETKTEGPPYAPLQVSMCARALKICL